MKHRPITVISGFVELTVAIRRVAHVICAVGNAPAQHETDQRPGMLMHGPSWLLLEWLAGPQVQPESRAVRTLGEQQMDEPQRMCRSDHGFWRASKSIQYYGLCIDSGTAEWRSGASNVESPVANGTTVAGRQRVAVPRRCASEPDCPRSAHGRAAPQRHHSTISTPGGTVLHVSDALQFTIHYTPIEDGWVMAQVEEVPGALSQGRTREEARENVLDALRLMLTPDEPQAADPDRESLPVQLAA
jgi:predicted RNase H-like HicB family nuclease